MNKPKDNFSEQALNYASFRPVYPSSLLDEICQHVSHFNICLDCGTGNGQLAQLLSARFKKVVACDISQNQLKNAVQKSNITYVLGEAEALTLPSQTIDLITVGQAIHWFNFECFYAKVRQLLKPNGILALTGYGLMKTSNPIQEIIYRFYYETIGKYWDSERAYIDQHYQTIPFPLSEINSKPVSWHTDWNIDQLVGYIGTWSAVQHYIRAKGVNPIDSLRTELTKHWTEQNKIEIEFPMLLRIGKLN